MYSILDLILWSRSQFAVITILKLNSSLKSNVFITLVDYLPLKFESEASGWGFFCFAAWLTFLVSCFESAGKLPDITASSAASSFSVQLSRWSIVSSNNVRWKFERKKKTIEIYQQWYFFFFFRLLCGGKFPYLSKVKVDVWAVNGTNK